MRRGDAYSLFEKMIELASAEIVSFTKKNRLKVGHKKDRVSGITFVTACDKHLDRLLSELVKNRGLSVVSEEGKADLAALKSGNYITIDAVDGTIGYVAHANSSASKGLNNPCIDPSLDKKNDYCLLVGIVENGTPRFGCCFNYVTGEKIFLDSESNLYTIRTGARDRAYQGRVVQYFEDRSKDAINKRIFEDLSVDKRFNVGAFGLRMLLVQLGNHESAVAAHFAQENGLWDILPAAVAAQFTGAVILDGNGNKLEYTKYITIPEGVIIHSGDKFSWIGNELKK